MTLPYSSGDNFTSSKFLSMVTWPCPSAPDWLSAWLPGWLAASVAAWLPDSLTPWQVARLARFFHVSPCRFLVFANRFLALLVAYAQPATPCHLRLAPTTNYLQRANSYH